MRHPGTTQRHWRHLAQAATRSLAGLSFGQQLAVVVLLALTAVGSMVWAMWAGHPATTRKACVLMKVYDGDTMACDLNRNGRIDAPVERVRLLGIDAPEMHYSRKNKTGRNQPYAQQATAFLLQYRHRPLYLEYDQQRQDRYGRTLAYAYTNENDPHSLNERLLSYGLARVLFYPPNRRHEPLFVRIAFQARMAGTGLWKTEQAATRKPEPLKTDAALQEL